MRFYGKVYKDGKFWLAEVPLLDAMTQGHTRKEAFAMVADLLESLVNRPGFSVTLHTEAPAMLAGQRRDYFFDIFRLAYKIFLSIALGICAVLKIKKIGRQKPTDN